MGGRNHPDIDPLRARGSHALEFSFLQDAEKSSPERPAPDRRSRPGRSCAVGQFEALLPYRHGAGEGALLMTEPASLFHERGGSAAQLTREAKRGGGSAQHGAREQFSPVPVGPSSNTLSSGRPAPDASTRAERRAFTDDVVEVVIAL
jgi:hypothetical protein